MKKFLVNLLLFSIPLMIISVVFEYKTRTLDSYYKDKRMGLENNAENIEALILGNSLAADGIDPSQFQIETYNMAFRAQSLYFDKRITLKYLNRLKRLKYVFINVSYSSLYMKHKPERDVFYHYFYDISFEDRSFLKEDLSWFYFGYTPEVAIRNIFDFKERMKLKKGWTSYNISNNLMMNEKSAKRRVTYYNSVIESNLDNKTQIIADLEDFIFQLKAKNITPILVTPPFHPFVLSLLDKEFLVQDSIDIQRICLKHDVEHWNYLYENFSSEEFYNPDHLNELGAKKLAGILNNRLNERILNPRRSYVTLTKQ